MSRFLPLPSIPAALSVLLLLSAVQLPAQTAAGAPEVPIVIAPVAPAYTPLSPKERLRIYVSDTYGPFAWLRSAAVAGISQWEDDPPEWPQGMRGYGYRFGSKMGRFAIQETLELGAGLALGEDSRYFACECRGIRRRTWYAVTHSLIARTRDGRERFASARAGSIFGAAAISVLWYPTGYPPWTSGIQFGATALASRAGFNVFKEFWPDIRRKVLRRKR